MNSTIIVGAQWGDEGKGKAVDLLSEKADVVVRTGGGANAGHTLVVGNQKIVTHLIPSGIIHENKLCVMGHQMVIDPITLFQEITDLKKLGLLQKDKELLKISRLAHIVMPYHIALDKLREAAAGKSAIGTTGRGIGPTYEYKARRLGIRIEALLTPEKFSALLAKTLPVANAEISRLNGTEITEQECLKFLNKARENLSVYVDDISTILFEAAEKKLNILFEGAQGAGLDLDHGTYPFVTSSNTVSAAAAIGAGLGPNIFDKIIGVSKAYVTRVGNGPFPTKLTGELAEKIRKDGGEYGATTGRPRDVGWVDLVQLRYSARINGLTGFFITKLDILRGLESVWLCTAYKHPKFPAPSNNFSSFSAEELFEVEPVYEDLPGFTEDISSARNINDLPANARQIITRICEITNVPLFAISVGPERNQTINL